MNVILSTNKVKTMKSKSIIKLLSLMALISTSASAGTLYLTEINSTDVALTGAGWSARANDATTAYTNPAGMIRLEGSQYEGMLMPIYLVSDFEADSDNTVPGNTKNADAWLPSGSFYYANRINDKWAFGVSVAGYFGLGLDYDDDWAGRYFINESLLQTIGIVPSVAYKIDDKWSVGAALTIGISKLKQTYNVNNVLDGLDDGLLTLEDETVSYQPSLGVLYQLDQNTRFGLSYLFEADLDFEDIATPKNIGPTLQAAFDMTGLTNSKTDFTLTLPQMINVSFFHQLNSSVAVLGNTTWQEWSKFGLIEVDINSTQDISTTIDKVYEDVWGASLGMQYQYNEKWLINTGVTYNSRMVEDKNRGPDLPLDSSIRLGLGGDYALSDKTRLKFAYELLYFGDVSIDKQGGPLNGRLSGEISNSMMHFMSISYSKEF